MGHIKGERHDAYDRLHYADGSHRGTARSANGSELDWFARHHQAHMDKHRELTEPVRYVWAVRDFEGTVPAMGTLADYAKACEAGEISGAFVVSSSLWTWDDQGRPVEHVVETKRRPMTEGQYIPVEYRANNEVITFFRDGAA